MAITPTANYGYSKQDEGDANWEVALNSTLDLIDADLWAEHNADGTHKASTFSGNVDINGNDLILDADGDTYLHESADDVIDLILAGASGEFAIHINGAEDFKFTANAFNVLAGSSIVMGDGATLGQAAGPLITFDDTLNYLEIMGCKVGIGVAAPAITLDVRAAQCGARIQSSTGTNSVYIKINNTGGDWLFARENSVGNSLLAGASAYDAILAAAGAYPIRFGINNSIAMSILNGGSVGIGTILPDRLSHAEVSDAATNAVTYAQRLSHITSGTAVAGFGTGIEFELEENDATNRVAAYITADWQDAGEGASADGRLNFGVMTADAAAATVMSVWNKIVFIGDSANAKMTQGLTIKQSASDDEIAAFKSSDVAHATTTNYEADTYGSIKKAEAAAGGLMVVGLKDGDGAAGHALHLRGILDEAAADTTKTAAGIGVVTIDGCLEGANVAAACGADENLMVIRSLTGTRFIFDQEGEMHSDAIIGVGDDWDEWDDLALASDLSRLPKAKFDDMMKYKAEDFERAGLVTLSTDKDGNRHAFMKHGAMLRFSMCCFLEVARKLQVYESALLSLGVQPEQLAAEV